MYYITVYLNSDDMVYILKLRKVIYFMFVIKLFSFINCSTLIKDLFVNEFD